MANTDVVVRFLADTNQLDQSVKSVGSSMSNLAKVATAAFAGSAFIKGAKDAIDSASNLNESLSKSQQVFGKSANEIEKWARTASKAMGQSEQQALEAAASFGNMFNQIGIGEGSTKDMSKAMVGLASDFASFHNADITEVLQAQQAAFRGEYDALQKFVPTINAAAVEQEALKETHKATTKELTAGEKAAATYTLMMQGAGKATGDFARTADGAANQQRILSAEWENAKAKLGSALLPAFQELLPVVMQVLDAFTQLPPQLQAVILVGGGAAATFGPLISGVGNLARAASESVTAGGGLGKMVAFLGAGGPWLLVAGLAAGAVVGITQALGEQSTQLDVNIEKFGKLNNLALINLIQKLEDTGNKFGDTKLKNEAFTTVLEASTVEAQRWITAADIAGINTQHWSDMLDEHLRHEKETKEKVDESTAAIDRRNDAINKTPPYKSTQFDVMFLTGDAANIPAYAEGGIVTRPTVALIGERGPEAIIPLSGPGSGSGDTSSTYNINVTVGAGSSPAEVGAQIVDQIRYYERLNGKAWRN